MRLPATFYSGLLVAAACGCVYHADPPASQSGCGADDPRVGNIAELTTRMHGVSGTARIVDNCTIVIEKFNYDGIAADSRAMGVKYNDFVNGVVLTGPLMKAGGYKDATLTIKLPDGVTLDDVPMISICCLVGNDMFGYGNFGEGIFHPPGTPQPDPLTYWTTSQPS